MERVKLVASTDFRRLSYTDAISVLQGHVAEGKVTFEENDIEWGMDLGSEHERCVRACVRACVCAALCFVSSFARSLVCLFARSHACSLGMGLSD